MSEYPSEQTQVAPLKEALSPQEGAEGSHCPEASLKKYPLAQEPGEVH